MTAPALLRRNDADGLTGPVGFVVWQVNNFNYERSDIHLLPLINTRGVGRERKKAGYISASICVSLCVRQEGIHQKTYMLFVMLLTPGYPRTASFLAQKTIWGGGLGVCLRMCVHVWWWR